MPTTENQELRDAVKHISHKFRTPMNVISSAGQLLQKSELTEKQRDYINRQLRAIDTMTNVLDELLDKAGEPTRHSAEE